MGALIISLDFQISLIVKIVDLKIQNRGILK